MDRREFLKNTAGSIAGLALIGAGCSRSVQRPNIILIMADDMGFSDIGCYGGEIDTPNLDRLAANGLRFTQFYNQARCCPTRASLMTGLYPHQTGWGHMEEDRGVDGYRGDLNRECVTVAEVLKETGYSTYMAGKWHLTRHRSREASKHNWPCQRGFDRFYGTIIGANSYFDPTTLTHQNEAVELTKQGKDYYYTDAVSDFAVKTLEEHKNDNPFFLYVAYTAPHWPLQALDEDIEKYRGRFDGGWDRLRAQRLSRLVDLGIVKSDARLTDRDPRVKPWHISTDKEWQLRRMEVYAAQVDRMDQGIGRILKTIESTGRMDDTLIIFLSDNGGCAEEVGPGWAKWAYDAPVAVRVTKMGQSVNFGNDPDLMPGSDTTYQSCGIPWANVQNTPFRLYKHFVHEGGISSPFIMHWPNGFPDKNGWRNDITHLIDIMPTCVDAASARYPGSFQDHAIQPMEGRSLLPVLRGKEMAARTLYWEHEGNRAVRRGKWKLVAKGRKGSWELYDMEQDRTELVDLSTQYPTQVKKLAAAYDNWANRARVIPDGRPEE